MRSPCRSAWATRRASPTRRTSSRPRRATSTTGSATARRCSSARPSSARSRRTSGSCHEGGVLQGVRRGRSPPGRTRCTATSSSTSSPGTRPGQEAPRGGVARPRAEAVSWAALPPGGAALSFAACERRGSRMRLPPVLTDSRRCPTPRAAARGCAPPSPGWCCSSDRSRSTSSRTSPAAPSREAARTARSRAARSRIRTEDLLDAVRLPGAGARRARRPRARR